MKLKCLTLLLLLAAAFFLPQDILRAEAAEAPTALSAAETKTRRQVLRWSILPGAVAYEVEILEGLPENPKGTEPSRRGIVRQKVFTPGYQADFSSYQGGEVWWRVRGLAFDGAPVGVFSDAKRLKLGEWRRELIRPEITTDYEHNKAPLYPVYAWIPVAGAAAYEVELLDAPPAEEEKESVLPSRHRIWNKKVENYDCYDELPRNAKGRYFWRVRGLDEHGGPLGWYSQTASFSAEIKAPVYAATLGDSITHGGGDVSYSPADPEYNYQTYLDFPTVNLGRSGDTARQILERFERDVLPYRPKYLIILAGTNSLRGGVSAETVIFELGELRDKAKRYGIRPVFLTLPPLNPVLIAQVSEGTTSAGWREAYDKVNDFIRRQDYAIDIAGALSDERAWLPEKYALDGLHPGQEGKKLIAEIINANWPRVSGEKTKK